RPTAWWWARPASTWPPTAWPAGPCSATGTGGDGAWAPPWWRRPSPPPATTAATSSPSRCGPTTRPPGPCTARSASRRRACSGATTPAGTGSCGTPWCWDCSSNSSPSSEEEVEDDRPHHRQDDGRGDGHVDPHVLLP